MTEKERKEVRLAIETLKNECNTLEDLYLSSKHIQYRWIKQSIEENVMSKLKKLL